MATLMEGSFVQTRGKGRGAKFRHLYQREEENLITQRIHSAMGNAHRLNMGGGKRSPVTMRTPDGVAKIEIKEPVGEKVMPNGEGQLSKEHANNICNGFLVDGKEILICYKCGDPYYSQKELLRHQNTHLNTSVDELKKKISQEVDDTVKEYESSTHTSTDGSFYTAFGSPSSRK